MKANIISDDSLEEVMKEVVKETLTVFNQDINAEQRAVAKCFFSTLSKMTTFMFEWLPPQEAKTIMEACGTWFDIGLLFGKSPQALVDIIKKTKARITEEEIPDWLNDMLRGQE